MDDPIITGRLLLPPLAPDAIQALIDGDGERVDALTGARFPRPVAAEAGVALAPTLYTDALSAPGGEADSYEAMVRHNVETIVGALGG